LRPATHYVCSGRIADPRSCSQRSIRRELIDEPLLATLLDTYIDLAATRKRIEERTTGALTAAREALEQAQRETAKAEAALARVERDYLDGKLSVEKWERFEAKLAGELEAAQAGEQRSQGHVQQIELAGAGDAEASLLDLLGRLKRAVGEGVGEAPDLHALRNVIGHMFASVDLVRNDDGSYLLLPSLRVERLGERCWDWEAAGRRQPLPVGGAETLRPIGQDTPSPPEQSYPPTFLARYCWW
jgi:hypothetical protein